MSHSKTRSKVKFARAKGRVKKPAKDGNGSSRASCARPQPTSREPEWRQLYVSEPPQISRDLLVLGLGYRLQEIDQGGLGRATRRKLKTIAKNLRKTGRVGATPSLALKPGARLVRAWRGRAHTVTVTEDGFEYAGTSYASLTKIAKKITGAHWSGPRFFGLLSADRRPEGRDG